MNLADDLITADHHEMEVLFDRFDARPHRSIAIELCDLVERHRAMEDEILHPALRSIDASRVDESKHEHDRVDALVVDARHTSSRSELKRILAEMRDVLRAHVDTEESQDLPAMESALGVAEMNQIGFRIGDHRRNWEREGDELEDLLDLTRDELYERAQAEAVDGRSSMNKQELAEALATA